MSATNNDEDPISPFRSPKIHITSHIFDGKAMVHSIIHEAPNPYPGYRTSTNLVYTTSGFPPDLNNEADIKLQVQVRTESKLGIVKPNGTIYRIVDFTPNNRSLMHRTQSIDFGVVLEGEIIMISDDGSLHTDEKGRHCCPTCD